MTLALALFAAPFPASFAEEAGTNGVKKEEVKKKRHKGKNHGPRAEKEAGEGSKSSPPEGSGVTASVNRAGKKVMDAAHKGAEAVKDGLNEGYDRLKNSR